MKHKLPLRQRQWYKLDNAAKAFPGQNSSSWSNVFRLSATLTEKIDPALLQIALERIMPRFPCFDVRMRNGLFWHYLEKNPNVAPSVMPDMANPCLRIKFKENKGYLFRVYYYENRISVEFYHVITDGFGGSRFFMTLIAEYLRQTGKDIPSGESVFDINEAPKPEESEDAYLKNSDSKAKAKMIYKHSYQFRGVRLPKHRLCVTTGYIPVDAIKEKAKEYGVTVTEYLASVLVWVMYNMQKEENVKKQKPIGVQIPVNVRNLFPSETLRNFMLCYCFQLDPNMGDYTFEEITRQLSLYLRYVNNQKELKAMMKGNAEFETNPLMRVCPSFVKDFAIKMIYVFGGEKATSSLISNVGIIKTPKEMEQYIEKFAFVMGPGMHIGARCGAFTYKDTLALSVSNIYEENIVQRNIFTTLVKFGIPVKIESNRHIITGGDG